MASLAVDYNPGHRFAHLHDVWNPPQGRCRQLSDLRQRGLGADPPSGSSSDDCAALLGCVASATSERDALRANGGSAKLEQALERRLQVQDRLLGDRAHDELDPERRARLIHARFKVQQQLSG